VSGVEESYAGLAAKRAMQRADGFWPGPLTPLLVKGGEFAPALRGALVDGVNGVIARHHYRTDGGGFTFNVVFASLPESQPFVPRLFCNRKGRWTDTTHYGFEIRNSRLWTESEVLNERFKVTVSPFQDDNWLRQLFAPSFVDWVAHSTPEDFSFELAYGSLLCSVEEDEPDQEGLAKLWECAGAVAKRIREESRE
jgi:hypothetical protein